MINNYGSYPVYTTPKFVPFWNPEHYFNDLETNGTDSTHVRQLHENCVYPADPEPTIKKKVSVDKLPYTIYEKYFKKNKKAPIDEYIKALYDVGYSEDVLLDVMKKDAKRKAMLPELTQFIVDIFGEVNDKKVVVKKKTLNQILKMKKKVYAMPEPEETPNDDYEENPQDD